ncbi:hypothetical protein AB6A40_003026 [Gnathostoma spinigerum]|uniref:Uncharacterized protein n=1 Tax=Gnathostoma spinigerum TaxID=75299 RepID=A0ABD6EAL7_9BILA
MSSKNVLRFLTFVYFSFSRSFDGETGSYDDNETDEMNGVTDIPIFRSKMIEQRNPGPLMFDRGTGKANVIAN